MQWCREGIADHFAFFQITECGMEFFELVKVVEDSFYDLIDDLFRCSGLSDKGCTHTKGFDVIGISGIHSTRNVCPSVKGVVPYQTRNTGT